MSEICWHDGNCSGYDRDSWKNHKHDGWRHFYFGRCRSGRRWFWTVTSGYWGIDDEPSSDFGWEDSEAQTRGAALAAIERMGGKGQRAVVYVKHGHASHKLREVNRAKRAARPAAETADAKPVEYLFAEIFYDSDWDAPSYRYIKAFPIVKKTKRRIFYRRQGVRWPIEHDDGSIRNLSYENEIGFVDRQKLEADGEVWIRSRRWHDDSTLYLNPPEEQKPEKPDLRRLKAEMAAAHPDRGGTSEAFIAARARYVAARREARSQ